MSENAPTGENPPSPENNSVQASGADAGGQLYFFSETALSLDANKALEDAHSHEFTGELLEKRRPDVCEAIARAYVGGVSLRAIARAFRVSVNTVTQVLDRRKDAVETHKAEVLRQLRRGQRVGAEYLAEEIERGTLTGKDLAIAVGIVTDQIAKLEGAPGALSLSRPTETVNELAEVLRSLPSGSVVAIGVGGQPVGGGGEAGQKETVLTVDVETKGGTNG